ncbi:PASTA domain-containing protein [candidate division KSB1 bacterium]|nr:PASTA domain-containing protein [candidate division KSB1 bacterium]
MSESQNWFIRKLSMIKGIFASILLIIVLAMLMDQIVMPLYTKHGSEIELPDVTERSFEDAKEILETSGFTVIKEQEVRFNPLWAAGTVLYQNPTAYSRVKKGRRIYLTLCAGEKFVLVPRVTGNSELNAEFILKQAGLQLGEVFYEYSDYFPENAVSDQSVAPNDTLAEKTLVDITVSIGSLPSRFLVPDLLGKSLDEAKTLIRKAGLKMGQVDYEPTSQFVPETVLSQSLQAGEEAEQNDPVDLIVSQLREDPIWEE